MSFFSKVKQALGIGTISVKINVPGQLNASDGILKGSLLLTAKSDGSKTGRRTNNRKR